MFTETLSLTAAQLVIETPQVTAAPDAVVSTLVEYTPAPPNTPEMNPVIVVPTGIPVPAITSPIPITAATDEAVIWLAELRVPVNVAPAMVRV